MSKNYLEIMGVRIDQISLEEAIKKCLSFGRGKMIVYTPNPEILLHAQKNAQYREILNKADLNCPDGSGIIWAGAILKSLKTNPKQNKWLLGLQKLLALLRNIDSFFTERVTGVDLAYELFIHFQNEKIFILGGKKGAAKSAKIKLEKINPNLKIVGIFDGESTGKNDSLISTEIDKSAADVLFVALGSPKQEIWIEKNISALKHVRLVMGIGGAIDFLAGETKRAPIFLRKIGMEWLWRLLLQPKRLFRIIRAVLIFPYKFLRQL